MKVLFAAAEGVPFYKTGGLGDVAYALPKTLRQAGVDIRVVLPYYGQLFPAQYRAQVSDVAQFTVMVGGEQKYVGIKQLQLGTVPYYFIDNEEFFGREGLYGYWDDGGRFGFFQMAIIEMLQVIDFIPDVLHLNDWHTAFIPVLLKDKYSWITPYQSIKTQLTIHNLQFQGWFPPAVLTDVFGIGRQFFHDDGYAQNGAVNFLKGGINFADLVSTVSPSYAREIQTPQFGEHLDGTLRKQAGKLVGILNGIDTQLYDPATDKHLPAHYTAGDLSGKAKDKRALQRSVGLPQRKVPLFGIVSRLTRQKGMDQLLTALNVLLPGEDIQVVMLGTGDSELEVGFNTLRDRFAGKVASLVKFDEALAQQIYAGADFFVMPSAFEPSGLAQMMAMRYGTLPIVHETGGLRDSVTPYDATTGAGTGFSYYDFTPQVLIDTLVRAAQVYRNEPAAYQQLQQQAMAADFAWPKAAKQYLSGYERLLG
ncbi:MAG: glycogen synthase GlgA [Lactobacillus sp.]|jgi:starch synthase|uniref:Glycogen synthase n=1 Tax=Lacticaseibacillus suilingensis TaxID=2799577 RepID=A0ABW4BDW2_9LACO|nr:glycogen synthase GlgA [Lacticaseibacillus suilingensis]MCI1893223.1 glycogen synthase GlgA [Lactobacillus sp.]MCI1917383.1 glycogen synthase GlgA [Lactobacillus sp.]MCI1940827.1 glycogen synthase GlgA [Lactobacillus sp.]MCI1971206.1 glycogen synthase GlgA [Lactobacillus sp.]MCI2017835.1 glycogen synthase GlgA [Lactobacillus sp.]